MSRLKYKRLSNEKNWKIKKLINGNGDITYKCYHKNGIGYLVCEKGYGGEFTYEYSYDYEFVDLYSAQVYIEKRITKYKIYYLESIEESKSKKIIKSEKIGYETPQIRRKNIIDDILG